MKEVMKMAALFAVGMGAAVLLFNTDVMARIQALLMQIVHF